MAVQVKVCGITSLYYAAKALESGATFLGLIFVPSSPRQISAEDAEDLGNWKRETPLQLVGVFKDPSAEEVDQAIRTAKIKMVQLHGNESVEFCQSLELPLIKTIEIKVSAPDALYSLKEQIEQYVPVAKYLLFDKPKELRIEPTWIADAIALLKQVGPIPLPYFFAGGLNPGNVNNVIAELEPFGVDVASGIESKPGEKDIEKMKAFFEAVRRKPEASRGTRS